jgi:hypothetical protein
MDQGLGPTPKLTSGASFAQLGWIDRATEGTPGVTLVQGDRSGERELVFWNDELLEALRLPGSGEQIYPNNALRASTVRADRDLRITTPMPREYVAGAADSYLLQLAGPIVATSADSRWELRRVASPARAEWITAGFDGDGQIVRDVSLQVIGRTRVTVHAVPAAPFVRSRFTIEFGDQKAVYFSEEEARAMTFDLCDQPGPVAGRIAADLRGTMEDGRQTAGRIDRVQVERCS